MIESVTILDTAKVINRLSSFCCAMSIWPGAMYPNDRKVALYVHISCLIERLIRHASPAQYTGGQCPDRELATLREAFSVIESGIVSKFPL